jgi:hypothetical protein
MQQMNKNRDKRVLMLKVAASTAGAAAILFLGTGIINWHWVLHHEPDQGETLRNYFLRCMVVSSFGEGVQLAVLLLAVSVLAIIRKRHSMLVGVLGGVVLFLLDVVAVHMGLQHHSRATATVVYVGLPALVAGLQFCSRKKDGEASNQASDATSEPAPGRLPHRVKADVRPYKKLILKPNSIVFKRNSRRSINPVQPWG